jgi:hypothetical protein
MFLDSRLGNTPQWLFGRPRDWGMRVPEAIRKSVGFLARATGSARQIKFRGTGFIVSVPSALPGMKYELLVTAKHVADQLLLGDWVCRMNTKDGRFMDMHGTKDHPWWFHPTEKDRVDVAVTTFHGPQESAEPSAELDATAVPLSMFLDDESIRRTDIGPGSEVFMTGLFNKMSQNSRNLPIVRMGNVALIPGAGELVPGVTIGGRAVDAEAYLIEARSIGGISGSPVFVRTEARLQLPAQHATGGDIRMMEWLVAGQFYFLGLVHGHWEVLIDEKNEPEVLTPRKYEKDAVNLGIAVVIPAKKIREVVFHPELVEMRNRWDQQAKDAQGGTTPD